MRATLRRARLDASEKPAGGSAGERGEPVASLGPSLRVERNEEALQLACSCGHVFGRADSNWKLDAARLSLDGARMPPQVVVHQELELVQYVCPACGVLLATEIEERGAGPLHDIAVRWEVSS